MEKELNLKTEIIKKSKTTYVVKGFLSNTDTEKYLYYFLEQHGKDHAEEENPYENPYEVSQLAIRNLYERIIDKLIKFALQEIGKNAETSVTIRNLSKGKKGKIFLTDGEPGTQYVYTLEIDVFDFISNNKEDENKFSYENIEEILEALTFKTYETFLDELPIFEQGNDYDENFQNAFIDYKQNVLFEAIKGYANIKDIELEKGEEFLLSKIFLELFYMKNLLKKPKKEIEEKSFIGFFQSNYKNIIKRLEIKTEINTPEDDILGVIKEVQEKNLNFFNEILSTYRADQALLNILFSMAKGVSIAKKMFDEIVTKKEELNEVDSQQTC